MENPAICIERAERDRAQAEEPSTTPLMRERLLESARRWEEMAVASQRFNAETERRDEETRKRVEARKVVEAGLAPPRPKRVRRRNPPADTALPVLVLRKSMIYRPEPTAIAAE